MEILRRIFVVVTVIWLGLMLTLVCEEINNNGNRQYQACLGTNPYAEYDQATKSKCHYAAEYANLYTIIKFLYGRNERSDEMRWIIWLPVGLWWGLFYTIGWVADGSGKRKGN
jgi:hypothetical protein